MRGENIALERLRGGPVPVVVLGDLTLVRPLGAARIPVVLAALGADDVTRHSRYVQHHLEVPGFEPEHADASAARLCALGARLHALLGRKVPLFYNSDRHLEMLYRHRAAFSESFLLPLNDEPLAGALHDKARFYPLCEAHGVLVPRTLQSADEIEASLQALREPLLVKPKRKTAWRPLQRALLGGDGKARVFATRAALRAHPEFARFQDEIIVQECIAGDVGSLYSFHGYVSTAGRLLAAYGGRKIRTWPMFAGESCFIELVKFPALEAAGREVIERLGLRGPFKIDFIRDAVTGRFYTLEINARFNLWNQLGAAHGINLPALAYDSMVHGREPTQSPDYTPRYRWLDAYRDYLTFREEHQRGALGWSEWLSSLASPRIVYETFAWRDPLPFVQWATAFVRERW
jgi:predicted ATP-grasp superfamily ATP-dependent carboligase